MIDSVRQRTLSYATTNMSLGSVYMQCHMRGAVNIATKKNGCIDNIFFRDAPSIETTGYVP